MDINRIRKAVTANRGGFEDASDSEIITIWNMLDKKTQEDYSKGTQDAVSTGTRKKNKGSIGE